MTSCLGMDKFSKHLKFFKFIETQLRENGCLSNELLDFKDLTDEIGISGKNESKNTTIDKPVKDFPKLLKDIKTCGRPKDSKTLCSFTSKTRKTTGINEEKLQEMLNDETFWLDDEIIFSFLNVFKVNFQGEIQIIDPLYKDGMLMIGQYLVILLNLR